MVHLLGWKRKICVLWCEWSARGRADAVFVVRFIAPVHHHLIRDDRDPVYELDQACIDRSRYRYKMFVLLAIFLLTAPDHVLRSPVLFANLTNKETRPRAAQHSTPLRLQPNPKPKREALFHHCAKGDCDPRRSAPFEMTPIGG
jgi:hypothetical protein